MEGPVWQWRKVNVLNLENAPKKILCHQACKVILFRQKNWNLIDYQDYTTFHNKLKLLYFRWEIML